MLACSLTGSKDEHAHGLGGKDDDAVSLEKPAASHNSSSQSSETPSSSSNLVPNNPEVRYREVLAIPLARRPLFPGGIMPVTVTDSKIIKELVEVRRQGYEE